MRVGGTSAAARALAVALLAIGLAIRSAAAQEPSPEDLPVLLSADRVTYDENLGIVTASGNVELAQEGRVLLADSISYNLRTNVVTASGNISLLEPSGDVVFADFVELTDDLREGFIRDIRILLSDRSRLAAASGTRTGDNLTVFRKGVFSPCELCREDPTRAPLWQLKAVEVEHDQEARMIRYRDAWLEMFGVPVLYTPYLEHPDPTVERKSGFLAPTFGNSEVLGTVYQQPYFWNIAPDKDATFAPILTTERGAGMAAEYRQLFETGEVELRGSAAISDRQRDNGSIENDAFRGHIDSTVRFDIDDNWRWGVDAQRASDDTYLRVFNFSSESTLTSRAFVEGFNGRNYLAVNNYLFQGLRRTDQNRKLPIVHPLAEYHYLSEPGTAGGRYAMDASLLALTRVEGRDTRRASVALGWELPYTGPAGDIYNLVARVQGDGYWATGVDPNSNAVDFQGRTEDGFSGRLFPQLALQWRYPWVRHGTSTHQVLEPMAQIVAAPNGSNPGEIPNEDSLDFEFDDTNLFSLNRFTGEDRVDSGSRIDYGLGYTVTGDGGGWASAFVGQSYRFSENDAFSPGSGVRDNLSDIVGRIDVSPTYELRMRYRFRFDKDDFTARRNELDLWVGPPALNLNVDYTFAETNSENLGFAELEEINWTVRSKLTRYWSVFGSHRLDLDVNETRQARIGLIYQDECFYIETVGERTFFSDREIEPEDSIFVNVVFKYLGGFSGS